jgi:hypothetical protein
VSGGYIDGNISSSVEYTEDGTTFNSLPPMPEAKSKHSMAVLENGNIFVAGGCASKSCFLYESERRAWTKCPDMRTESKYGMWFIYFAKKFFGIN